MSENENKCKHGNNCPLHGREGCDVETCVLHELAEKRRERGLLYLDGDYLKFHETTEHEKEGVNE